MNGFSKTVAPLTHLIRKGVTLNWLEECECSFQLKDLVPTSLLTFIYRNDALTIYSDASKEVRLGADAK